MNYMHTQEPMETERSFSTESMMFGTLAILHFSHKQKMFRPYAEGD